ncbi:MAG: hypothetical protein EXR98_18950 [Gemmataceae bacterium]|nr:hypothetical protein [Gemmataceae bacterium]
MPTSVAVFLDFNLPNATTWFYFSSLLAVALFFKFSRLLCVRNLDVGMMFLLAPGLLLVLASRPQPVAPEQHPAAHVATLIGRGAVADSPGGLAVDVTHFAQQCGPALERSTGLWIGYLWLLVGSVYFFCRCLLDLTLVQRPALAPNLQTGGLAWLAGALLICLLAVAYRQVERHINPVPSPSSAAMPLLHPYDQSVFAVAILWRGWPVWAVAALAFAGHVAVIGLLVVIAWRHFQDVAAGVAGAAFYLMLPYTGASVGQIHHVLPMALFLGTVLTFRFPALTGALLGVASAATYFPLFVLPIWLGFYRNRGVGRFLAAFLIAFAACLAGIASMLWLEGEKGEVGQSIQLAMESTAWQPWKSPTTEGFWTGVHSVYRIPIFLLFLSFVVATMFWPAPKNLAHVIALSAAVFISLQWWGADQGGVYILWYVPLLLLLVFRPNLQDRVALPIDTENDWLMRSLRWCLRKVRRILKRPEPAAVDVLKNGRGA